MRQLFVVLIMTLAASSVSNAGFIPLNGKGTYYLYENLLDSISFEDHQQHLRYEGLHIVWTSGDILIQSIGSNWSIRYTSKNCLYIEYHKLVPEMIVMFLVHNDGKIIVDLYQKQKE
jgi:hypothetical protein